MVISTPLGQYNVMHIAKWSVLVASREATGFCQFQYGRQDDTAQALT
jgi:hypothetical protein